jgi:hypothetical protein
MFEFHEPSEHDLTVRAPQVRPVLIRSSRGRILGSVEMSTKAPNPVDKYVGSRVRMRRIMLGMSQEKLGEALGLTFQQVTAKEVHPPMFRISSRPPRGWR